MSRVISLLGLCLLLCATAPAIARRHPHKGARAAPPLPAPPAAPAPPVLANGDPAAALAQLERAYSLNPSPDLLYSLGQLAKAQGRTIAALDLLRRYLEQTGDLASPERRAQIAQLLAAPRAPTNEVKVAGERGALLFVDDRLAGSLPLALPLLVSPGVHGFRLEKGKREVHLQVTLPPGRQAEVRLSLSPAVALVRLMQAVLLQLSCQGCAADAPRRIEEAVAAALATEQALLVRSPPRPAPPPGPRCADALSCLEEDARRAEAQFILDLRATTNGASATDLTFAARLYDVATGTEAGGAQARCPECSDKALAKQLVSLLGPMIVEGSTRTRGILRVRAADSSAEGATVQVDGRVLGRVPFERAAFTGARSVRLEKAGHFPVQQQLTVIDGQAAQWDARLERILPPPRPRQRPLRVAGWVLVGTGLVAVAAGAVLWGLDGQLKARCSPLSAAVCAEEWDGQSAGLPALVPGAVSVALGGALLGLDARRQKESRPVSLSRLGLWSGSARGALR